LGSRSADGSLGVSAKRSPSTSQKRSSRAPRSQSCALAPDHKASRASARKPPSSLRSATERLAPARRFSGRTTVLAVPSKLAVAGAVVVAVAVISLLLDSSSCVNGDGRSCLGYGVQPDFTPDLCRCTDKK